MEELKPGLIHEFIFTVPESKTVPHLFPEAAEFQVMPHVLATGYLVGLIEWACIQAIRPHINWPLEQSVGIRVDISHMAATPPGMSVTVRVELIEKTGRKLKFEVQADDDAETICRGTHERFIIDSEKFIDKITVKQKQAGF